jgi:Spy/CpxP family protein refolding chaperone
MKKISLVLLFMFSIAISFAQIQRAKSAPAAKPQDSIAAVTNIRSAGHKKEMMKELNLTKEQKSKLKEIKQAHKAQLDEVQNDAKLSAEEKKAKLKTLKLEQLKKTMAVLNEEQKAKMKAMRRQNKKEGKGEELMEEQQ